MNFADKSAGLRRKWLGELDGESLDGSGLMFGPAKEAAERARQFEREVCRELEAAVKEGFSAKPGRVFSEQGFKDEMVALVAAYAGKLSADEMMGGLEHATDFLADIKADEQAREVDEPPADDKEPEGDSDKDDKGDDGDGDKA